MAALSRDVIFPPVAVFDKSKDFSRRSSVAEKDLFEDVKVLGSFNWHPDEGVPVMIIPGQPRHFVHWRGGQLAPDSDTIPCMDEDMVRLPEFPLEPTFRCVDVCCKIAGKEIPNFSEFDIATNRKNLRQLFTFCDYNPDSRVHRKPNPFRIDLERVGNTILMTRNDPDAKAPLRINRSSQKFNTYGIDFEQKCTSQPQNKHELTSGVFREVLSYKLGFINCLVTADVDCVRLREGPKSNCNGATAMEKRTKGNDVDALADSLAEKVSLKKFAKPQHFGPDSHLQYIEAGSLLKPGSYDRVELATRFESAPMSGDVLPKMIFAQTQMLALGRHNEGLCRKPELMGTREVVEKTGTGRFPIEGFRKLVCLLQWMIDFVRSRPEGERFALVWFSTDRRAPQDTSSPLLKIFVKNPDPKKVPPGEPLVKGLSDSYTVKLRMRRMKKKRVGEEKKGSFTVLRDVADAF